MVNLISQNQPSSLDAFIINFQTWVQFIVRTLPLRIINKSKHMNFQLRVLFLWPCLAGGLMVLSLYVSPLVCLWTVFHKTADFFYDFLHSSFVATVAKNIWKHFFFSIFAYRFFVIKVDIWRFLKRFVLAFCLESWKFLCYDIFMCKAFFWKDLWNISGYTDVSMTKIRKLPRDAPRFADGVSGVEISLESKYATSVSNAKGF